MSTGNPPPEPRDDGGRAILCFGYIALFVVLGLALIDQQKIYIAAITYPPLVLIGLFVQGRRWKRGNGSVKRSAGRS